MKNRALKRLGSLLLTGVLAAGMIGCGSKGNGTENTGERESTVKESQVKESEVKEPEKKDPVTLTWYYYGNGEQEDTQKVEDHVNELLKEVEGLEHVTIDLVPGTTDFAQEVLLAQTSGKQIDLLHTYRLSYTTEIANGTFIPIDEYLESEEFTALRNELPDWLWNCLKVDGQTYIVPGYQMAATDRYFVVPTEYVQYLTEEDLAKLDNLEISGDTATESIQDLQQVIENLTVAVREATGKDYYCYPIGGHVADANNFVPRDRLYNNGLCVTWPSTEATNYYLSDYFQVTCEGIAKWVEEGLYPKDGAVQDKKNWGIKYGEEAKYVCDIVQQYGSVEQIKQKVEEAYGFDVTVWPLHENYFIGTGWGAGGTGITAACEHPLEAMRFLQLINTEAGQEIYNTIVFGLEGEHWVWEDESIKRIKTLEYDGSQGGSDTSYAAMKWIIGNTAYQYLNQAVPDDEVEVMREINENPDNRISNISGFNFDYSDMETELSQMASVISEYRGALLNGSMGSGWKAYYDEFVKKMEAAGLQTVLDATQAQIDAYLAK